MQPDQIGTLADLEAIYRQYGWIGAAAGVVYLLLRAWQSGLVDSWLSTVWPGLVWDQRTRWARLAIVFALSLAATTLTGIVAGQAWWSALVAGC